MKLRCVAQGTWSVMAICDSRGDCQVRVFLEDLAADSQSDYHQTTALLRSVAMNGPPRNEMRSRPLADKVFELKTRGGIRILYFYDDGRLVICTEALRKPKKRELRTAIALAAEARTRYLEAKRHGALEIIEEET